MQGYLLEEGYDRTSLDVMVNNGLNSYLEDYGPLFDEPLSTLEFLKQSSDIESAAKNLIENAYRIHVNQ
jgi:hypothetical protein